MIIANFPSLKEQVLIDRQWFGVEYKVPHSKLSHMDPYKSRAEDDSHTANDTTCFLLRVMQTSILWDLHDSDVLYPRTVERHLWIEYTGKEHEEIVSIVYRHGKQALCRLGLVYAQNY